MNELMQQAIQIAKDNRESFGIGLLQSKLKIGYFKCAKIIDSLENMRIIGCYDEKEKKRKVLV